MIYFRFPYSDQIFTTDDSSSDNLVSFISFDGYEELHFKGNLKKIKQQEIVDKPLFNDSISNVLCEFMPERKDDYEQKVQKVIDFVKAQNLSKLVISRRELVNFAGKKLNLSQSFLNLCESYPNAFVYFFIKDGKSWIGAFSEVLGKFKKQNSDFETMSLAGTIPVDETWTHKEIEEQQPVTDYIRTILNQYSDKIDQSETYDHPSGNIKHLRTDFQAKIKKENLENVINELHPTPAVCGFPKEFCRNAIAEFEKFPRNFYAGYIKVETEETIQYFVNLRCAEILKNAAFIYVGGGITAESSPEKEWQETVLKSQAILKNLFFS